MDLVLYVVKIRIWCDIITKEQMNTNFCSLIRKYFIYLFTYLFLIIELIYFAILNIAYTIIFPLSGNSLLFVTSIFVGMQAHNPLVEYHWSILFSIS